MNVRQLFLDFDGPVCDFFAGFPAADVANCLRNALRDHTPTDWMTSSTDPHEILRATGELGTEVASLANSELAILELEAVQSAKPTPYASEVIRAARDSGFGVVIVSNNAASAVMDYLTTSKLLSEVAYVSARVSADPSLMKPNPYLVTQAIEALNADRTTTALVGDQVSDVVAAHSAGIRGIGFANKPGKRERFQQVSADLVITSMSELIAKADVGR